MLQTFTENLLLLSTYLTLTPVKKNLPFYMASRQKPSLKRAKNLFKIRKNAILEIARCKGYSSHEALFELEVCLGKLEKLQKIREHPIVFLRYRLEILLGFLCLLRSTAMIILEVQPKGIQSWLAWLPCLVAVGGIAVLFRLLSKHTVSCPFRTDKGSLQLISYFSAWLIDTPPKNFKTFKIWKILKKEDLYTGVSTKKRRIQLLKRETRKMFYDCQEKVECFSQNLLVVEVVVEILTGILFLASCYPFLDVLSGRGWDF